MTPCTRVYAYAGLLVRSAVPLALAVEQSDHWDVDVRSSARGAPLPDRADDIDGDLIAEWRHEDAWWYVAVQDERGYRLRFRGCGEFHLTSDLTRIDVYPDPNGRPELLPILLAGTVLSFVLTLRGETVLHASAVSVGSSACAFVGPSGRGKSTLAMLMCREGATLVADDVLTVQPGDPATCVGGSTELRLRSAARPLANELRRAACRTTTDDRLAVELPHAGTDPLPLSKIIIPQARRDIAVVSTRELDRTAALTVLLGCPRVLGWRRADVLARDFQTLAALVDTVPVLVATVPWGPPFASDSVRTLDRLVRESS